MKERRIAFTRENRGKSRQGLKTQTRRLMNPQPYDVWGQGIRNSDPGNYSVHMRVTLTPSKDIWLRCPYGAPGDRLYLLEPYIITCAIRPHFQGIYLDDEAVFKVTPTEHEWNRWQARKDPYAPTQARFMYKSLARTWFDVVEVRAERLQDISDEGAIAEGIESFTSNHGARNSSPQRLYRLPGDEGGYMSAKEAFENLWDSINGKRSPWARNDWVWVVTYKLTSEADA